MKPLYIICEGQSEQIFVEKLLIPYLYDKHVTNFTGYGISAPILRSHKAKNQANKGGNVSYTRLKNHIDNFIKQTANCYVTTFIDFYGIGNDFPNYNHLNTLADGYQKIERLELDLQSIDSRVIPYIQLHEYETIYFADINGFLATDSKLLGLEQILLDVVTEFVNNPELINNSRETAPSKRITKILQDKCNLNYKNAKTLYATLYVAPGEYMRKIDLIRSLCPHFDSWINRLLELS